MNVHAFMNELDQKDYWSSRKIKNCENLYMYKVKEEFVVCPAQGRERARVVPREQKDSLSLYPAERALT